MRSGNQFSTLGESGGQRVLLHVFPVTRDLRQALVGMRGVVFIQPREDVFHIESSFQVINIGLQAWVPDGTKISLPSGAKGFRTNDSMSDTRVERGPSGDATMLQQTVERIASTRFVFLMALEISEAAIGIITSGSMIRLTPNTAWNPGHDDV